jgi:hypothetical protein
MSKPNENVLPLEAIRLLSLLPDKLPALLYANEVGWILGLSHDSIKILTRAGLIDAVGRRSRSERAVYLSEDILRLRADAKWLHEAKEFVKSYWREINFERKKSCHPVSASNSTPLELL